ncbi:hypothetical protein A0J61_11564 [Choanephora cucurbitarum]|uniref:Uncharacterized protein n=1 Tax=Choanephora cucurbitarum TaxID=101091 RepID=A0A1C7MUF1_9FUNG|nr:hypothetical protein A0J61_11564 [Choanephora cucurbitarum]
MTKNVTPEVRTTSLDFWNAFFTKSAAVSGTCAIIRLPFANLQQHLANSKKAGGDQDTLFIR